MTSLKILTAAAIVAVSAPAFASDGGRSETIDTKIIEFFAQGQTPRLVEGRNSDRVVVQSSKAQAATSQGFAPIDTDALLLRGSSR